MELIDTHCHLDVAAFARDREVVIGRARAAGVKRSIVPAFHFRTIRRVLALADDHHDVWAAVGVHPRHCADWATDHVDRLRRLAGHRRVVALGEIGLDYSFNNRCARSLQATAFAAQLELAAELDLPTMIHFWTRPSYEDALDLVARSPLAGRPRAGVLDHFRGDAGVARRALDLGLHIGLAGPITYARGRRLPAVVADLPLDRLLIETDAPAVPPEGHRGERNEPAHLPLIAQALATIRGVSPDEVAAITTHNAMRLFWPDEARA